jgi:hypothetical protein
MYCMLFQLFVVLTVLCMQEAPNSNPGIDQCLGGPCRSV